MSRLLTLSLIVLLLLLNGIYSAQPGFAQEGADTHTLYLPLVSHSSPAPTGFTNGNFEDYKTGWTVSSTNNRQVIGSTFGAGISAHAGRFGAWLGSYAAETSVIQQQVTVDAATPVLVYWQWIVSTDQCDNDKASVLVNGAEVESYILCTTAQTNGWAQHTLNLSAYAGQSITLAIQVVTDVGGRSDLYIDDMGF